MKEHEFADLLSKLDPELVARAEAPVPRRRKPGFRIALVAAALAILICAALLAVPFIPKTLDVEYPLADGTEINNIWIWYTTKNGRQRREYVRLPENEQNVFLAWAHLNELDGDVKLVSVELADPNDPDNADKYATITVASALSDTSDTDALFASLEKTYARYYGVQQEQLEFVFTRLQITLEFSHDLQKIPTSVGAGKTIEITVTMTNISDRDIVHVGAASDFVPLAKLCMGDSVIYPQSLGGTEEIAAYRLAPGESKSITYTFEIPYAIPLNIPASSGILLYSGECDLVLFYGEYSYTVSRAVLVSSANLGKRTALEAFYEFSEQLVPNTRRQFTTSLSTYTCRGQSVMADMTVDCMDGQGFFVESGEHETCSYTVSSRYNGWVSVDTASFTANEIPDGWTLPMGITEQDDIVQALSKIGLDEQIIGKVLGEQGTLKLAGPSLYDSVLRFDGILYLHCTEDRYVIEHIYTKTLEYSDVRKQRAEKYVFLYFNREDLSFESVKFTVQTQDATQITFDQPVVFTQIAGKGCNVTLTEEQTAILQQALFEGMWQAGQDSTVADCQGQAGSLAFSYSSTEGIAYLDGLQVKLLTRDQEKVNEMLGCKSPYS